jgi:hypothetical protein
MDTGACVVIALLTDLYPLCLIIAELGMVEAPIHELSKGNRASRFDLGENESLQPLSPTSIFSFHMKRKIQQDTVLFYHISPGHRKKERK